MKINEAINLIEKTFNNNFDENQYKFFIINLLKKIDDSEDVKFNRYGVYIPDAYKEHIKSYKRIGKYQDEKENEIDLLIVNLKKNISLERARTMQRNFIAWYLKTKGEKDCAIVVYHSDDSEDWRFSFIKMEYLIETDDKGKIKTKQELTPAKRYSFLVGKNEPNHTAQNQLLPLLQFDENIKPSIEDIERVFNIESVTKEFFEKYKGLFLTLNEELEKIIQNNSKVKNEFETKKIETSNFSKKLLGQIVFLYFLQKKGWLGIERDDKGDFKNWGTGYKDFLRRLFEKKYINYNNFFNDILEPLFYEALATDRGKESYYSRFDCKIPFLNGGLFEAIGNYNWEEIDIPLKDELFRTIFDTFDLYNFTIREDEPLEKEVAVDPEMLGKVFENLLEVKDRKSKGAFYTPREIVHYMCQESLINYLDSEINQAEIKLTNEKAKQENLFGLSEPEQLLLSSKGYSEIIKREDLETFIKYGEFAIQNDIAKEQGTKSYNYKMPENIRKNARLIDEKLEDIKICDPAIGSGAFPVGIMTEIVKARNILSTYFPEDEKRTLYNFKRNAIQESIYGVDIDSSSVDIAKLRLWLSLVVDEDDYLIIKPLPNLDYRIVCGNSLLGIEINLFNNGIFSKLENLKNKFRDETRLTIKRELKLEIDTLINTIIKNKEIFDFKLYFSEVFHKKNGFDIVIGNPPYVGEKGNKEIFREIKKGTLKKFYQSKMDLFYFFFHLALEIGKENAQISFITTNYFTTSTGGKTLRKDLSERSTIRNLIDLNELKIFESALGQHNMITIFSKNQIKNFESKNLVTKRTGFADSFVLKNILNGNDELTEYSNSNQENLYDGNDFYIRSNSSSNFDNIFFKIKYKSSLLGIITNINAGCDITISKLTQKHIDNFEINQDSGVGVFVLDLNEFKSLNLSNSENIILKDFIKNSNIIKYSCILPKNKLIYLKWEDNIELYPNIKKYLLNFKKIFDDQIKRYDEPNWPWFSIHRPRNQAIFESKQKIIVPYRTDSNIFGYADYPIYSSRDVFFITNKDSSFKLKYILALLNSKLYYFWLYNKGKRKGETLELYQQPLSEIPIKHLELNDQDKFINIVNQIIEKKKKAENTQELENKIDIMVYKLYNLDYEEVKLIDSDFYLNKEEYENFKG